MTAKNLNYNHFFIAKKKRFKHLLTNLVNKEVKEEVLLKPIKYSLIHSGKYIRPMIVYAIGKALKLNISNLDKIAAAIEIIHSYSLIHDDLPCMDNDDYRRGKLSCHKKFGESTAILTGDAMQALAFQIISRLSIKNSFDKNLAKILYDFSQSIGPSGLVAGQLYDLGINNKKVKIKMLEKIYKMKTGELIKLCLQLPLHLKKDIKKKDINNINKLSILLGTTFQIQDDYLGATLSFKQLGKTTKLDKKRNQPNFYNILGEDRTRRIIDDNFSKIFNIIDNFTFSCNELSFLIQLIYKRNK